MALTSAKGTVIWSTCDTALWRHNCKHIEQISLQDVCNFRITYFTVLWWRASCLYNTWYHVHVTATHDTCSCGNLFCRMTPCVCVCCEKVTSTRHVSIAQREQKFKLHLHLETWYASLMFMSQLPFCFDKQITITSIYFFTEINTRTVARVTTNRK